MAETIETNRCNLNPPAKTDREDIFELYNNKHVRQFLGGIIDKEKFNSRFEGMLENSAALHWVIRSKDNGDLIGMISIDQHHDGIDQEVSYQILPKYWGKGYALEAVRAVMDYASSTLNLNSIIAETQEANEPSKKLLEKLGMHRVKTLIRFDQPQVIYQKFLP